MTATFRTGTKEQLDSDHVFASTRSHSHPDKYVTSVRKPQLSLVQQMLPVLAETEDGPRPRPSCDVHGETFRSGALCTLCTPASKTVL